MIIDKETLAALVKLYLPHANDKTVDRIINKIDNDADEAVLAVVWEAVEGEETSMNLH